MGYDTLINSNRMILKNKWNFVSTQKSFCFFSSCCSFLFISVMSFSFTRTLGRLVVTLWALSLGVWNFTLCLDRGPPFSIGFQYSFLGFPLDKEHFCISYILDFQENLIGYQCNKSVQGNITLELIIPSDNEYCFISRLNIQEGLI
jgi:hypothetical protein